jgi:prepilin-type N-terminal cleavage/methylation domain-containing protein
MGKEQGIMNKKQTGFTIIELLVATTIFSIILVIIVSSFLQVGRMFYKGVSISNTNEAARNLVDTITNDARLANFQSGNTLNPDGSLNTDPSFKKYFCVGPHRYTYWLAQQVKDSNIHTDANLMTAGVVQDETGGSCRSPADLGGTRNNQVLGPDMQINKLSVVENSTNTALTVSVHIVFYGADNTVFNSSDSTMVNTTADPGRASRAADAYCSGNLLSTQFCAVANIDTNVTLRY